MKNKKTTGFTLLEVLIVLAIIGVLASVVMLALKRSRLKAANAKIQTTVHQFQIASELYLADHGGQYVRVSSSNILPGWDMSSQGNFLPELKPYMAQEIEHPNNIDSYLYINFQDVDANPYNAISEAFRNGCSSKVKAVLVYDFIGDDPNNPQTTVIDSSWPVCHSSYGGSPLDFNCLCLN